MKFYFWFMLFLQCVNGTILSAQEIKDHTQPALLFLKGSPYELGYQHGQQLKVAIAQNIQKIVDDKILANRDHPQIKPFLDHFENIVKYIPQDYLQELRGLADGAQIPYEKILLLNVFPEMFHCTGMTLQGKATKKGELYHVRVLDYAMGQGLQKTAVIMVVQPKGKNSFLNVSYAGFIGSVTGMNDQHIALGEIGGKGYGHYEGIPMAFLLRKILEQANHLDDVKELLDASPRTCEYYYVFSDGKSREALGVYATPNQLRWFHPGESYAIIDQSVTENEEKIVLNSSEIESSSYQALFYKDQNHQQLWGLIHQQPKDCLILMGFAHPARYPILIERLLNKYGKIGIDDIQEMIKMPVARQGNLHNAIFDPTNLHVWISHAGPHDEPACDQHYLQYHLPELLKSK